MRKILTLIALLAPIAAFGQTSNGTINSPIYATGYISQGGGTNVTTTIPAQSNHPTNLNIYTTGAISGIWTIKLPNPAFEGQILTFNCGAAATAISITSSDGSTIDSLLPSLCSTGDGFAAQFDIRNNIWRNAGSSNTTGKAKPFAKQAHKWLDSLGADGVFTATQPTYSDIAGSIQNSFSSTSYLSPLLGPDGNDWITFGSSRAVNYNYWAVPSSHTEFWSAAADIVTTNGSGTFGPSATDTARLLSVKKNNYLTSTVEGEIDPLIIIANQGRKGDVGGSLYNISKVRSGAGDNGGALGSETSLQWLDTSGTVLQDTHVIVGYGENVGALTGGGGAGFRSEPFRGRTFAAYMADANNGYSDGAGTYGHNWLLYGTRDRNAANSYFKIRGDGNLTGSQERGEIVQGTSGASKIIRTDSSAKLHIRNDADTADAATVDDNGNALFGIVSSAGQRTATIDGGSSGTGDGAAFILNNNGSLAAKLGNQSTITGGAFTSDFAWYQAAGKFSFYPATWFTAASSGAVVVGPNGSTNPTLNVDTSTASVATGVNIKGAAAGGGVAVSTLSSGANENLTIDAKGSGTVTLGGTSTGKVVLRGTATNDSAAAGFVGEYTSSTVASGSVISLTNGVSANVTSISLTAGDWDVEFTAQYSYGATTAVTYLIASVSTTSATIDQTPDRFAQEPFFAQVLYNSATYTTVRTGAARLSLSSTTTVYGVVQGGFSTSTLAAWGILRARRVR